MSSKEFTKIYNENVNFVFFKIKVMVKNKQLAEDLTNETFIKVYQKFDTFDSTKGKITTWINNIAKNTVIDYVRVKKNTNTVSVEDMKYDDSYAFQFVAKNIETDKELTNNELSTKLDNSFNKLKPNYQKTAILFFKWEYSYNEIAEILDVPLGTVKGTISRCRELLQKSLITQKAFA